MKINFLLLKTILFEILIIKTVLVKQIYSEKCCFNAPNGDVIITNCAYTQNNDCCKKYDCTKEEIRTMTDDESVYIYYTPWYMRWYIWFTIGLVFFLCSAFCTFCKKKHIFGCFKQNRTSDLLLITNNRARRNSPTTQNDYNASSMNNDCATTNDSNGYCYTISSDRFLRNNNIDAPPTYWQSVETPQYANYHHNRSNNIDNCAIINTNTSNMNTSTPQNLNYSNHEIQVRPPPAYNTLNKSLFHKSTTNDDNKNEANETTTVATTTTISTAFQ